MNAVKPPTEEQILGEVRDRWPAAEAAWSKIREEGREDIRYVAGDLWTSAELDKRKGRPNLAFDEIGQYVNQLINEVRLNKRAILLTSKETKPGTPADKLAQVRANLIRQIEYQSNAQQCAYMSMFESAAQRSYGWLRITARYVDERSWNQELVIQEIPNPEMVLADPEHLSIDGSDLTYLFFFESYTHAEFKRRFGEQAETSDFTADVIAESGGMCTEKHSHVAEYWVKRKRTRKLLLIPGPNGQQVSVFEDELPKGGPKPQSFRTREAETSEVWQCVTNGVDVLEKPTRWPGKDIPFVPCYGKQLFVHGDTGSERRILSQTRHARGPAKAYVFARSTQIELVSRTPKIPAVGVVGQFKGVEKPWNESHDTPMAYLEYNAMTPATGPNVLGPPVANPYDAAPVERLEIVCEGFRRAIQAAMGTSPLPTSAQRRNEKSGKALQQIEESGQKGSFHFVDHYEASIRRTGEILNDLLPHYYDAARDVTVRKPDDTPMQVRINDPNWLDPETKKPTHLSMKEGTFDVTISTGPAFDSQREAESEFADMLLSTPFAERIADLAVRLKNIGPTGDEIAKRLTPPEFQKPEEGDVDPAMMQRQLAEAKTFIEALTKQLEGLMDEQKSEKVKGEVQLKIAEMDNATKIRVAEIAAAVKGYETEAAHAAEHEALALNKQFDAADAEAQRQHEAAMADMGHQQQLEAGQVGHQQALEQSEQQAALQPPGEI